MGFSRKGTLCSLRLHGGRMPVRRRPPAANSTSNESHLNEVTQVGRTGVYIHFLICTFLMVTHGRGGLGMFGAYHPWYRPKLRLRSRVGLRAANLRVHVLRHHTLVRVQHDRVTAQQANLPYTWAEPGGSDCLLRRGPKPRIPRLLSRLRCNE